MTDIIERLRRRAQGKQLGDDPLAKVFGDAADEIERLRGENNDLLEALANLLWEASDKSEQDRIVTRIRATALIARIKDDDFKVPDGVTEP